MGAHSTQKLFEIHNNCKWLKVGEKKLNRILSFNEIKFLQQNPNQKEVVWMSRHLIKHRQTVLITPTSTWALMDTSTLRSSTGTWWNSSWTFNEDRNLILLGTLILLMAKYTKIWLLISIILLMSYSGFICAFLYNGVHFLQFSIYVVE